MLSLAQGSDDHSKASTQKLESLDLLSGETENDGKQPFLLISSN